jgi:hypothetical protein
MSDGDILDHATLHELSIFVSIDGISKDGDGIATISISIVAPDICEADVALEC